MTEANHSSEPLTPTGAGDDAATAPPPDRPKTAAPDARTKTPGWYPHPSDTHAEIYWDGARFHGNRKTDPLRRRRCGSGSSGALRGSNGSGSHW